MKSQNSKNFGELPKDEQQWIEDYLNETISQEDFEALEERMRTSPELRACLRSYLSLDHSLRMTAEENAEAASNSATAPWLSAVGDETSSAPVFPIWPTALAACIAFIFGLMLMKVNEPKTSEVAQKQESKQKAHAKGFAAINQLNDAQWAQGSPGFRRGDTLSSETITLESGMAEIQFFSGAVMTLKGPSEITLQSAWEATCLDGNIRMRVPPAARGFKLNTDSSQIIDLGTEFGLQVRDGESNVEVFEGEIAVTHEGEDQGVLEEGHALGMKTDGPAAVTALGSIAYPTSMSSSAAISKSRDGFAQWQAYREYLREDSRLLAYYTFEDGNDRGLTPSLTTPRNSDLDGAIILAEPVAGRWSGLKPALEFRRPGARVRVNIPGEFQAFTFASWVRIDGLNHEYSAFFMGDGYENGEPHWQIRNDGKVMLSVMVHQDLPHPRHPESRFHHVYLSPQIWDISMSGQWIHLAATMDPEKREVCHYLNGEQVSKETITDEFFVEKFRIGNGEIGNWGQPFRKDPSFAIRNLNGRMDEMAIFKAALSAGEIQNLYHASATEEH